MTALATEAPTRAVTVPRSELARALRAASSIKSKNVRIDLHGGGMSITGSTGSVAVRVDLATLQGVVEGSVIVKRSLLASLVAYLAGDVEISVSDLEVKLTTADGEFALRTLREDAFPACDFDTAAAVTKARYDAPTLREVLGRVLPFASRDETRPVLAAVALYPDANCAAATDSYRLAVVGYGDKTTNPKRPAVVVHVDAARSIRQLLAKQLGEVVISVTPELVLVAFEGLLWSAKRPDLPKRTTTNHKGEKVTHKAINYPQWWTLFPDAYDAEIRIDREELRTAARAARVVSGRYAPLRLRATTREVRVTSVGLDVGSMDRKLATGETTGIDKIGPVFEVGLNPEFVAHICDVAPVERLTLRLLGPLRPVKVEAGRDQYLLMPIRLNV